MTVREKLKKISQKFPNTPGVYFWMGADKKPLYIGRAGSLKKRIASYFLTRDPRIGEMVGLAKNVKFQKTDTLLEAIILEANLIRKYWPKYNVKEKDNRSFLYVVITNEEFPRLLTVRARELEKYSVTEKSAKAIFGPYQSYHLLRSTLEIIRKIFPYTTCKPATGPKTDGAGSGKPCFHYQIGLCPGVCIGQADTKEYAEMIRNLILFFRGDKKRLLARLKKQNPEAIKSLQHVSDVSLLSGSDNFMKQGGQFAVGRIEGYDISHLAGKEPVGSMVVFENGERDPSQYRIFKIRGSTAPATTYNLPPTTSYDDLGMLREVLERRMAHREWPMPDVFFIDGGLLQVKAARDTIARFQILVPVVGLNKSGRHAASAAGEDKLVALNTKGVGKDLLLGSKKLFQEVRNEAHRFAIGFGRRQTRKGSLTWRNPLK
jgi:excinuclease ABC subunit C